MIISRTPLRISFFGGGTDYPIWYKSKGGIVISATINKYNYITARYLPPFFSYKHRIRYYKQEESNTIEDIKHPSVRECAKYLKIKDGIEIVHNGDVPAQSGLGSSSCDYLMHVMPSKLQKIKMKKKQEQNFKKRFSFASYKN